MAKVQMLVELDYDAETMHSDDTASKRWFMEDILLNNTEDGGLVLHSNEIGDSVGTVKVLTVYPF